MGGELGRCFGHAARRQVGRRRAKLTPERAQTPGDPRRVRLFADSQCQIDTLVDQIDRCIVEQQAHGQPGLAAQRRQRIRNQGGEADRGRQTQLSLRFVAQLGEGLFG